jgi:hypothetical protein
MDGSLLPPRRQCGYRNLFDGQRNVTNPLSPPMGQRINLTPEHLPGSPILKIRSQL